MFDAIKPLLDSGLINEDVSKELNEAWDQKLTEAREQVRAHALRAVRLPCSGSHARECGHYLAM
mgnify:CR=1 FL=1